MKTILTLLVLIGLGYLAWVFVFDTNEAVAPTNTESKDVSAEETNNTTSDVVSAEETNATAKGDSTADVEVTENTEVTTGDNQTIAMVGTNYAYDVSEIRAEVGDTITIDFVSEEGFHDIVIDEFDVASERVSEGESTSVTFTVDRPGTFEYYCSVGNHRALGMVGTLVVE